jgi:hypothetical protein
MGYVSDMSALPLEQPVKSRKTQGILSVQDVFHIVL